MRARKIKIKRLPPTTGIAWYRPEDYARLMAMFTGDARLPDRFEEWLQKANEVCEALTQQGIRFVKAYIDPDTFPEWYQAREPDMNTQVRLRFGREYAASHAAGTVK